MAKRDRDEEGLFQRLSRLFRSGPVVKRKVRGYKAPSVSTAQDVFKRSASQVYGSAMSNMNGYDRLSRYSDFQAMEYVPEISAALDVYCLTGDNLIPLLDGRTLSIKELFDSQEKDFFVYSYDVKNKKYVPGKCLGVKITGRDQKIFRVSFDDGTFIRVTADHRVLLWDGTYREAKNLSQGDSVRSIIACHVTEGERQTKLVESNNHRVISVTEDGVEDIVYDLTVDEFHNFAVGIGSDSSFVIVHNSEECTAVDDKGRVLHVFSENRNIQKHLEELFYDTLNVEFNLTPWVRDLVKFGDVFLFLDVSPEYGVMNVITMPVNEVEREEGFDALDPLAVRFRWVQQGNRALENWQVAHFRLLGNDAFLPYGSSVLEPARRIWRQLVMIEDAMLVYRIIRSPERRVFYIDVGAIPPEEVPNYMEQAKKTLRSNQVLDNSTGRVDLRYNPLCHFSSTSIIFCDGTHVHIKDVAENWSLYKDKNVWSLDQSGQVVPSRLIWAGKTMDSAKFIEVELDDGQVIRTTPEHKWILRDGTQIQANQIIAGQSLMPYYAQVDRKITSRHGSYDNFYVDVYQPATEKWELGHRISGRSMNGGSLYKWPWIVHHKDHVKFNNDPDNLQWMTQDEHALLHEEQSDRLKIYAKSETGRKKSRDTLYETRTKHDFKEISRNLWKDEKIRKKRVDKLTFKIDSKLIYFVGQALNELSTTAREHQIREWLNKDPDFLSYIKDLNPDFKNGFSHMFTKGTFLRSLRANNFDNLREVKDFYVQVKAPFDRIIEFCQTNLPKTQKEIATRFGISRYDFERLIQTHGYTKESFDKEFLRGGYYGRKVCVTCESCGIPVTISLVNPSRFCSSKCYHSWRAGRTREDQKENSVSVRNHKVVSVRMMEGEFPAYCATVENSTHVLAVAGESPPLIRGKVTQSGVFLLNSADEDYFLPTRGGDSGSRIETLAGGTNTTAIEDVEYIQKKLFAALKVPKAYLSYDDSIGSKATLCLSHDTKIVVRQVLQGPDRPVRIVDLADALLSDPGADAFVHVWDGERTILSRVRWCRKTREETVRTRVSLSNKQEVLCTSDHPFLLTDGSYREAGRLRVGDGLQTPDGSHVIVVSQTVEQGRRSDPFRFYDLEVDHPGHNFLLAAGIFVHNSQEDVRFSRTINRIQRTILSELQKIATVHLYSHGYDGEDLLDFKLTLNNPSSIAQQQKLEIYRTKLEIASSAPEGLVDRYWIQKNVLNLTDDEIERIEEGKLQDKLADIRIEGATGEPVEPGTGGKGGGGGGGSLGGLGGGSGLGGSPGGDDDGPGGPDSGDAPGGGGGPEIDLSAPDLPSGGPDSGGGDESDSGEEEEFPAEEDLFSGRSLSGDLLTDVDEDDLLELDDDDEVILASRSGSAPLKVDDRSTVSGKAAYNRGRRRTHGAKALDQPDLARMVNHERPGDTMTDPFDSYSVNKLEGADPLDDFLNRGTAQHRRMTADLQSTLRNLKARMGDRPKVSRSVISEGSDGEEDGS